MGLRSCDSNTTVPRVDDILTARFLWQSTSSKQECTQTTYNTKIPIGSTRRLFGSLVLLPILQTRAAPSFGLDAIHSQLETLAIESVDRRHKRRSHLHPLPCTSILTSGNHQVAHHAKICFHFQFPTRELKITHFGDGNPPSFDS